MELRKKSSPLSSSNPMPPKSNIVADMMTESELDQLYLTLIQVVHLLGSAFVTPHFGKGGKTFDDTFEQLANIISTLKMPSNANSGILIFDSSVSDGPSKTENVLYSIQLGDKILTPAVAADVAKRSGFPVNQVLRKLQIVFDIFSLNGIHDLFLCIPSGENNDLEHIRICLEILSKYDQAIQTGAEIAFKHNKKLSSIKVIKGKNDQADPNLTLLAALNQLSEADMKDIELKVTDYIEQHLSVANPEKNYDIFNVLFWVKGFKENLIEPPIQVNNRCYTLTSNRDILPGKDQVVDTSKPIGSSRSFLNKTHNSSGNKNDEFKGEYESKVPTKISEDKFAFLSTELNEMITSLKKYTCGEEVLIGVIQNLKKFMNEFQNEIDKKPSNSEYFTDKDQASPELIKKFDSNLNGMLSGFNEKTLNKGDRSGQKQVKSNQLDIKKISKRFNLSISETKEIIHLLKGCFDSKDCFIRSEFEMRIPQFISLEKKIFEFLWNYLNKPMQKSDRVAFLNSLHLLISKMESPLNVLAFLLDELYQNPLKITFSDRNALILASLLLRSYNKEYSVDIELTPGEVLLVKNGLNEDILRFAFSRIDRDKELVQKKMDTIHNRLVTVFDTKEPKSFTWNPHFLLSLEREAFIFLSLVAADISRNILISVLSEYGNPKSKIYHPTLDDKYISFLLQHLKLLIRCLGRVGDIEDLGLLADLKKNESEFVAMSQSPQHIRIVSQVFNMIDIAMGNITSLQ